MKSMPVNLPVRVLLVFLVVSLPRSHALCPSKNGSIVDWWIIYQQRSMPFFHYYVDSTNTSDVSYHQPESPDSALSKAANLIIEGILPQYFLYSYDLINIMKVSKSVTFPMYSKWMQGILASDSNTQNGLWILHNNFLFPAISNGKLQPPTSSSWRSATIGDSSEDLFYVCLSLENRESLLDAVKSILAGNPFIYLRKLTDLKIEEYFTEITENNHPFSLLASANAYMECLTATKEAQRHRCMYQFATKNIRSIQVYTRPRGLLQTGRKFCYGHQTSALFEFVDFGNSDSTNAISSNNMFVISDEVTSEQHGLVCFGQDIAASSDTVAVMICGKLPGLWRTMVQASQLTNWGCPNHGLGRKEVVNQMEHMQIPKHHGIPSPLSQSLTAQVKTPEVRRLKRDVTSHDSLRQLRSKRDTNKKHTRSKREALTEGERKESLEHPQKRDVDSKNNKHRSKREAPDEERNSFEHPKKKDVDFKKSEDGHNKFLKYEEKEDAGEDKSNLKLERYMEIKMPVEKPSREKEPPKTVIKINTLDELQKSVVENENQLIAIFCRKGCRYCAATEPKFQMLIDHFKKEHVNFYHVDVGEIDMPYQLAVDWTPYVRFKPQGVTQLSPYQWREFTGEEYNFRTMYEFLDEHLEKMEGDTKITRTSRV